MRDEIDISAQTLRETTERMRAVDFSYPLWQYSETLVYRRPEAKAPRNLLLAPFQLHLWLLLLGTFVLVSASVVEGKNA